MNDIMKTVEEIRQRNFRADSFNESDHPRDESGKFTSSGSSGSSEKAVSTGKWKSPGIGDRLNQIKRMRNSLKAVKALDNLEKVINNAMQNEENDKNTLLTYRRQVRQLRKKHLTPRNH